MMQGSEEKNAEVINIKKHGFGIEVKVWKEMALDELKVARRGFFRLSNRESQGKNCARE